MPGIIHAQEPTDYEEIPIYLNIQQIGGFEIPGLVKDQEVYLPITDLFTFLRIKNTSSPSFDSISGYFFNKDDIFLIDQDNLRISYRGKVYELKAGDFFRTENKLYLRSKYFGQVFGLDCAFDFRALSVDLKTQIELPVIREMRQELLRKNLRRLRGDVKADTVIERKYPLFHFGMADWTVTALNNIPGVQDIRANFVLGSVIAGGEADLAINYSNMQSFREKDINYQWHFANNGFTAFKQILIGKIPVQSTSSINAPVVGGIITNTPTTYRQTFGTFILSDYTEPGWIVELYINSVLVDYVKADASGFFTFEVPLVYGTSVIKLRFYGPWGEELSREQIMSIPFNFLPPKKLEYQVSGGMVEDGKNSRFSRAKVNYGVSQRLTIGTGVEYLSSIPSQQVMPFANMSLRVGSRLMLNAEYTYGVLFKGLATYRFPSDMQVELDYIKYAPGQKAVNFNYLEERKAIINLPIHSKKMPLLFRLTLDQIVQPQISNFSSELLISGSVFGVNTNLTTNALFTSTFVPYVYSNLALGIRIPAGILLTPSTQYVFNTTMFTDVKLKIEKRAFRNGYLMALLERSLVMRENIMQFGVRYEFPFARAGVMVSTSGNTMSVQESANGSFIYNAKSRYLGTSIRPTVGRSGLEILPYLDLNCNDHRDPGEPKIKGLAVKVNGGRVEESPRDTLIRVFDIEPFANYLVDLSNQDFDNVAWQIKKKTINVMTDPNMLKRIEVPVAVFGEAAGMVYLAGISGLLGQGRIIIEFFDKDSVIVGRTITEGDGYFSYLGFMPGTYTARVNPKQVMNLHMVAAPAALTFEIGQKTEGDQAGGLNFVLNKLAPDTTETAFPVISENTRTEAQPQPKPAEIKPAEPVLAPVAVAEKQVPPPAVPPVKQEKVPEGKGGQTDTTRKKKADSIPSGSKPPVIIASKGTPPEEAMATERFELQVGAFRLESNARKTLEKLSRISAKPMIIISENGLFKVRITGFTTFREVRDFQRSLPGQGFQQTYILPVKR